jgi:ornithine cyclodeaminase/alanine dehydrogenase-like protein (mu-crystallin family)
MTKKMTKKTAKKMPQKLLILGEHEVEELLTMPACITVMEEALAALARGEVHQPLRQAIRAPGAAGLLGLMPAFVGGKRPLYGLKEVCVYPENPKRGLDTHLGAVLLHDGTTGQLLAVMNASTITAIRTAAVSALATRLLAREDASTLAIIGAGVQGRSHLRAIPLVRPIREVRIYSRSIERVAEMMDEADDVGVELITYASSVEEAVRGADVIVTATSSREPVIRREWIGEGTHINAVGSSIAAARELDGATVAAAALFVDRRESTTNESGDYLMALREGAIPADHIRAEIGDILIGKAQGRSGAREITLFKSLGLAIEDLAAAAFLHDKAKSGGRGTWVDFG